MIVRSISRLAICNNYLPLNRPCSLHQFSRGTQWLSPIISNSSHGIRGAKTKTTIKALDLPQGPLPPLKDDDSNSPPTKSYPTTLQQHLNNMRKFPNTIILTRVGDFYEMYFDQVDSHAHLVGLKKAKRKTSAGDVPMSGFQHWQLERYLKMFLDLGEQVAISEQFPIRENDNTVKLTGPQYDRRVTRIFTPGTLIDESFLDPFENNHLLAVHFDEAPPSLPATPAFNEVSPTLNHSMKVGVSWADISSGSFFTQITDLASLPSVVARISPKEVALGASMQSKDESTLRKLLGEGAYSLQFHQSEGLDPRPTLTLDQLIPTNQRIQFTPQEICAGNLVLAYTNSKLQDTTVQLQPPIRRTDDEFMSIDKQSLRSLEIRTLLRDGTFKGSLLHAIKRTSTKSGARLLSQRIVSPSMSLSTINHRLDLVETMLRGDALREGLIALLNRTSDTCRLIQKFSVNRGDADDLLGLARTIDVMCRISDLLSDPFNAYKSNEIQPSAIESLRDILSRFDLSGPSKVAEAILLAIDEDGLTRQHTREEENREEAASMTEEVVNADVAGEKSPRLTRRAANSKTQTNDNNDIWIMRRGASKSLKHAHQQLEHLLKEKQHLTSTLRSKLRADSLTLQWSPKLGHFCHLKGKDIQMDVAKLEGARSLASTKTTRTFVLEEWSTLGIHIDHAKYRIRREEDLVLSKLRNQVIENLVKLRRNAEILDELDIACSSAIVAKERGLVRPVLNAGTSHNIVEGRHPTVDVGLSEQGQLFTTNSCAVGNKERIYLITGPNMGGKSTHLRQVALITILAQSGCFVPAEYAEIGLVDKIFSRVGSADNLYQDQSTFMVEMLETAEILNQATPRSLVIMDEVGRGTTPEDGIAVGYACLHHLHWTNRSRVLFATHFHLLADMTADLEGVGCYCTDVAEEKDGSWAYVHKLRKGVNRQSHALKVAKLAGLPEDAVAVARNVLRDLHKAANDKKTVEPESLPLIAANG